MLAGLDFAIIFGQHIKKKQNQMATFRTQQVFQRIKNHRFKLTEKCQLFMNDKKYLQQMIDVNRHKQDPSRSMNVAILQLFSGFTNYFNLYVANMQKLRAFLNKLLKKDKSVELVK